MQIWHRKPEWKLNALDARMNTRIERVTPLENPAVNGPWICNKGRDLAHIFERPRAGQPMLKGKPVDLESAIATTRDLIDGARHSVAFVSTWGSNEELAAFKLALGSRFEAYVKQDWTPQAGEPRQDDLLIRADKNPNGATAQELFAKADDGVGRLAGDVDLVLVWGEGFDFARVPAGAKTIFLGSYLAPANGHADVFIPISIQTERPGHYTNFQGHVSGFEACFTKGPAVADAEALFVAIAATESATA